MAPVEENDHLILQVFVNNAFTPSIPTKSEECVTNYNIRLYHLGLNVPNTYVTATHSLIHIEDRRTIV
jgi:hypothetical protein